MSDAVVVTLIGLEQMIKVASHRIDDMEDFRKPGQEARA